MLLFPAFQSIFKFWLCSCLLVSFEPVPKSKSAVWICTLGLKSPFREYFGGVLGDLVEHHEL